MFENINNQLTQLRLHGAANAYREQVDHPNYNNMSFDERLSLLLERELLHKSNRRVHRLTKDAKLRHGAAAIESICYQSNRGLDKAKIKAYFSCHYVKHAHNLLITGPTGCGKTYIACALANQACRMGFKVRYLHLPKFLEQLSIAHADGSFPKLMASLQKIDLIILDDFGLTAMNPQQRHDLFNLIEDRYQIKSTMITSQLPVAKWHECIGEPTIADAILDRLFENAHRITMEGESMRRNKKSAVID